MSDPSESMAVRAVGVRDVPLVLLAPRRLFARVEDVAHYGWPLAILLAAVTVIGLATVQTGLIDRQVERNIRERIARIEDEQVDLVERSALRAMYDEQYKRAAFEQTLARIQVVVAEPARFLASILVIAAVLYGAVALTGRKPEWHTMLTVSVYAGYVDLLRLLIAFGLKLRFGTLQADTSAAPLAHLLAPESGAKPEIVAAVSGALTGLDPLRIWYWLVVIAGLSATAQLRGWRAWGTCLACWLFGAGARCAISFAALAQAAGTQTGGG